MRRAAPGPAAARARPRRTRRAPCARPPPRPRRSIPSSSGTRPTRRRSHSARSTTRPSARAADSGYGKAVTRRLTLQQHRRQPLVADEDAEHRLARRSAALDRTDDGGRDVLRARHDRRHEQHDDRVDAGVAQDVGEHGLERLLGRPSEHVDRVGETRLGREELRERGTRRVGERGKLEAGGLARVRGEDPEPAGVREQRDATPTRATAARRGAPRRPRAPRACRRGSRRPGGRAPRPRSPIPRALPCASRPPELRTSCARPSSRGSASRARRGARAARTCAGSRRTRGRGRSRSSRGRPPSTRAGRSRRRRPCSRSR